MPLPGLYHLSSNATTLLLDIIHNAGPDENLYITLEQIANSWFYPVMPSSYTPQLKVLSGIFALEFLIILASLVARYMNRSSFWIFRITKTSDGNYITPHFAVTWQIFICLFLLAVQIIIWVGTFHAEGRYVPNFTLCELLPFIPSYFSALTLSWSLYVAQSISAHARKPHWSTSPLWINIHFCSLTIVVPILVGLATWANVDYERVYRSSQAMRRLAISLAPTWSPLTRDAAIERILSTTPIIQAGLNDFSHWIELFRAAWIAWLLGTAYIYLIFCAIALRYFMFLRREFYKVEELHPHSQGSTPMKTRAIRSAFYNALWTCLTVTAVGVVFTAATFGVVFATRRVVLDGQAFNLVVLTTMWTFAICALPATILALTRSIKALSSCRETVAVFHVRADVSTAILDQEAVTNHTGATRSRPRDLDTDFAITSLFDENGGIQIDPRIAKLEAYAEDEEAEKEDKEAQRTLGLGTLPGTSEGSKV